MPSAIVLRPAAAEGPGARGVGPHARALPSDLAAVGLPVGDVRGDPDARPASPTRTAWTVCNGRATLGDRAAP